MKHYLSRLQDTIREHWDKPALCNYKGEEFTFSQLAVNIEKFHVFFENIGIQKGEKIAICARNSARWAVSFLSVTTYEAVAVPMLNDFLPDAVTHLTAHCDAVAMFTDAEIWDKMDKENLPALRAVINNNDYTLLYCLDDSIRKAYENLADDFARKYPLGFERENVRYPDSGQSNLAVINYTSGTTSTPKGVMLRHECFSAMVEYAISMVHTDYRDNLVSILPMGHIYGLAFEFIFPLCFGCTIFYLGKTPSPTLLLNAMKDVKPFMVVSVPLVMEKIYKSNIKPIVSKWYMKILLHIPFAGSLIYRKMGKALIAAFGGRVRLFIMGGAALNPEVGKCFRHMRLPYTVGYGMTEAAPLLAFEDWKKYVPGSCGKAVSCCEIRIDSDDPQHVAGEIQAKGVNICSGYHNNPEASRNAFTEDGFLHTGDLGIMDKDGNIFIKGRSKNMILSANGQNIYPEEVEAVINAQKYISESVLVDRAGKLVALVFLDSDTIRKDGLDREAASDIPENVRISANRLLPSYSQISKVEVVKEPFAKTPKMSIKRYLYS